MGALSLGNGGFPIDLILLGMVAGFLILRLRSILGKRAGYERQAQPMQSRAAPQGRVIEGEAVPVPAGPRRVLPEPGSPAGLALAQMRTIDRAFDPTRFLDGAETAFRMIVAAFASGNREALHPLLTPETAGHFDAALDARAASGETQRTEIRAMNETAIVGAELHGRLAAITVRFTSDQINLTTARDGTPLQGTEALTEISDLWTFERELGGDPAWRLAAARSA